MQKTLVCRCEDVTLHELTVAISRGHRDIESAKRYTGFATGFCQGKYCLALCARVIEEQGGVADKPITPRPPFHPVELATLAGLSDVQATGPASGQASGQASAPPSGSPSS